MKKTKIILLSFLVLIVFSACSPNPGGNDNDKNAFYIPTDLKAKVGEYTLMTENEVTGEGYIESGKLIITEDDVTATLTVGDSTAYIFGSTDSLKEFYNMAREADVNSVAIPDSSGTRFTSFIIGSATYRFDWQTNVIKDDMGVFSIIGTGTRSDYYMQPAN